MNVTKQALGEGYVVSAGVVLGLVLGGHAVVTLQTSPMAALIATIGVVPAFALAGTPRWLPASGLGDDHIWTAAQWSGLGIALLTLVTVAVLTMGHSFSAMTPVLLATGVTMAGATGVLVGSLIELRRMSQRLERGNAVLGRVIRHNLRNDLTVVLGHLDELERTVPDRSREHVNRLAAKIDDIVGTVEKARQIDVALATERRSQEPVDIIPQLRDRLSTVELTHQNCTVERDLPDHSWILADWFVKTVLDNVIENCIIHSEGSPELRVTVTETPDRVAVRISDDGPPISANERAVFSGASETPLDHTTGVGLWLVRFMMDGYDGEFAYEENETGGNTVELRFQPAVAERGGSY